MNKDFQRLARRQLSRIMEQYLSTSQQARAPRDGWIAAVREALGMSVRDLGSRMGVASSNASRVEQREREGTVTLAALEKAAAALDCDVVYAFVPRTEGLDRSTGDNLLDAMIMKHALLAAADDLRRVSKTMALEDQAIGSESVRLQIQERAERLAAEPRLLWRRGQHRQRERSGRGDE